MIKLSEKSAELVTGMEDFELLNLLMRKEDTVDGDIVTLSVEPDLREFIITKLVMGGTSRQEIENILQSRCRQYPKYDTDMRQYKDFQPTSFDPKGYVLDDQQDWYVVPVSQTRDSGLLEKSNFDTALEILGGECEGVVEIHRFGHWGPGWFEIIIINPEAKTIMEKAISIEASLADYPVLDDDDYSRREWEEMEETWMNMGLAERMEVCCDAGISVFAARRDAVPEDVYAYHLGIE